MLSSLFTLSALLFIAAMVIQILATQAFFNRLSSQHKVQYELMGKPRWKINIGDDAFKESLIYIRSKAFRSLQDDVLEGIYKRIKMTDYIAIASALIAISISLAEAILFTK